MRNTSRDLFFLETHEFVVEVDGFERLEEQRLTGGARAVNHAGQFAALPGDHRHHVTLVANGDVLFLQHAFVAIGAEEAFERFLNALLLLLDLAAETMEMRAGAVENGSVRLNLALDFLEQRPEIADAAARVSPSSGNRSASGSEKRCGVGGAIEERDQIEDFARFERRAFDVQFLNRDGDVGQTVEIDPDRAAAGSRTVPAAGAECRARM